MESTNPKFPYIRKITGPVRSLGSEHCVAGRVSYAPGGSFGPINQYGYQIFLLDEGSASVQANGSEYRPKQDECLLFKPDYVTSVQFSRTEETTHRWSTLQQPKVDAELCALLDDADPLLKRSHRMDALIGMILDLDLRSASSARDAYLETLGLAVLHEFVQLAYDVEGRSEGATIDRAQAWIRNHYHEEVCADSIADAVGVTRQHLARLYREAGMESPVRNLWQCRIEKAYRLLMDTGLTVAEVSESTGFQNQFHMSRKFKEAFGVAPREMRQRDAP